MSLLCKNILSSSEGLQHKKVATKIEVHYVNTHTMDACRSCAIYALEQDLHTHERTAQISHPLNLHSQPASDYHLIYRGMS